RHALLAPAHEDNPFYYVIVTVVAGDPQSRSMFDAYFCDVSHDDGNAAIGRDHGLADVFDGVNESNSAYNRRLRPTVDCLTATVDVTVVERLKPLRSRQAVLHEPPLVDAYF